MFDLADAAVAGALAAGAAYADARVTARTTRSIGVQNGGVENIDIGEDIGVGVRALIGSSWGFFATDRLAADAARRAGRRAAEIARASARVAGAPIALTDVPIDQATWVTPHLQHPMQVSMSDQADLLVASTVAMLEVPEVKLARGSLAFWDIHTWLVSSQGHRIDQTLVALRRGHRRAMSIGDGETQVRSYPQSFGQFESGGWETCDEMGLPRQRPADRRGGGRPAHCGRDGGVPQAADPRGVAGRTPDPRVGRSCDRTRSHPRAGRRRSPAPRTSSCRSSASIRYGSDLMNITADATLPGSLGSFGYDDEGTPASAVDIVEDGIWVGVLSGRDTAHLAGLEPGGMVKADGYARLPMVRMTNVGLLPGESSLEEMIASTEDGVYMSTNRSWSIDDRRLNFQFGCEIGWEIKDGVLGRMLKNPTYTGITPQFWGTLDMLAGPDEWVFWGTPNCGKGQPMQVARTGHPAVPARFSDVRMGVRG